MANTINLVEKMLPLVDEIYRLEAVTNILEVPGELVQQTNDVNSFKIAKVALSGFGDYDKVNGFPEGDITLTWETRQFTNDRGKRFSLDRMDNIESFGLVAGRLTGDFTRDYLVPEVDAYRFAKIAANAGKTVTATLTNSTAIDAVDEAIATLIDNKVNTNSLILFATYRTKQALQKNITRTVLNGENSIRPAVDYYDNIPIIVVPQDRFYTDITLNPGTGETPAFGYKKTEASGSGEEAIAAGNDINFILMDKTASVNITKLNVAKLFSPDVNQKKDAWQWDFRMYHDSFVFDNKKPGIYVHKKST